MKSYWWPVVLFVVAGVAAYLMQRLGWIPGANDESPVPHDEVSQTFVALVAVLAPLLTLFRSWSNRKAMDAGQNLRDRLKGRKKQPVGDHTGTAPRSGDQAGQLRYVRRIK